MTDRCLADVIGGYWFNGRTLIGYVDIEVGESVDFQVNGGFYPSGIQLQAWRTKKAM